MFLEIVPFATDVTGDFEAVGQTDAGDLAECGIRLLWSGCIDTSTDPASLRATGERRHVAFARRAFARLAHQLVDCGHRVINELAFIYKNRPAPVVGSWPAKTGGEL